jgi:hypothetical protein
MSVLIFIFIFFSFGKRSQHLLVWEVYGYAVEDKAHQTDACRMSFCDPPYGDFKGHKHNMCIVTFQQKARKKCEKTVIDSRHTVFCVLFGGDGINPPFFYREFCSDNVLVVVFLLD